MFNIVRILRRPGASLLAGLLVASALVAPQASGSAASADPAPNPVVAWNAVAGRAALVCLAPTNDPLHESRMYAMMHAAIHDALNSIERRARPYAFDATSPADASVDAAIAAAARDVLVPTLLAIPAPFPPECGQGAAAIVEAEYALAVDAIPDGDVKAAGLAAGQGAAAAILALRQNDGSDTPLIVADMPQGTRPGEYRFTPGTPFQFAPGWAGVTPFVLRSSDQFRASKPHKVTSKKYATDYNEVKALGGDGVTTPSARTPEQTEIAMFWVESSPLQWNRIARTVAADAGVDVWESARLFGLLNVAMADGYISSFETKNHYNFWRPVTAIHEGDNDGNRRTTGDATWTPLVGTPPIPDHDSAHAVEGAAAARVMQLFLRYRRRRLRDVQPDIARRSGMWRCIGGAAFVRQLQRGRRRERGIAGARRIPLPQRRERRPRARTRDRQPHRPQGDPAHQVVEGRQLKSEGRYLKGAVM